MYGVRLRHYPNNEIRLTAFPIKGRRFFYEDENENDSQAGGASPDVLADGTSVLIGDVKKDEAVDPPLSLPSNSELFERPGFGGLPRNSVFSTNGRRTIMRAGGAIDKMGVPVQNGVFFTGTIAGSTPEALEAVARWSGWIVDRVKSWLSKYAAARLEFYCWEWQQRGALHLHYFVQFDDYEAGVKPLERFHKEWRRLLLQVGEKSNIDVFEREGGGTWRDDETKPRTDAQRTEKSVSAYMAKYCSKGSTNVRGRPLSPSRWWGCSRSLLALLKSQTTEKEWVAPNCNSARRYIEKGREVLESECDVIHEYKSKCGRAQVFVGYHPPTKFDEIQSELRGEIKMDVVKLLDGSMVRTQLDLRNRLEFLLGLIPAGPYFLPKTLWVKEVLDSRRQTMDRALIDELIRELENLSFIDTGLSPLTIDSKASHAELVRCARFAWSLSRSLVLLRVKCFDELPSVPPVDSGITMSSLIVEQLNLFGGVGIYSLGSEEWEHIGH